MVSARCPHSSFFISSDCRMVSCGTVDRIPCGILRCPDRTLYLICNRLGCIPYDSSYAAVSSYIPSASKHIPDGRPNRYFMSAGVRKGYRIILRISIPVPATASTL